MPSTDEREGTPSEVEPRGPEQPEPLLWSVKQLSAALGIGQRTLWRMDSAGKIPKAVTLGRLKRWRRQEILEWTEAGCPDRRQWEILCRDE